MRKTVNFLDRKGIRNVQEYTTGMFGHTWMNARYFLSQTFPLLFNKEASEAAMSKTTAVKKPKKSNEPLPLVLFPLFHFVAPFQKTYLL